MKNPTLKTLFHYFVNGLLLLTPTVATVYVTWILLKWLDSLISTGIPGLGILVLVLGITAFGFLGSLFLFRPLWGMVESLLQKAPLINLVYSSLKDLVDAFMGDKNKFSKAVLVDLGNGCLKPGFVTQDNLPTLEMEDWVAVYFPHSYNFSGNVYLVASKQVKPVSVQPADFMKFIVSGGVVSLDQGDAPTGAVAEA
jgi:uncharacterized membrane protein